MNKQHQIAPEKFIDWRKIGAIIQKNFIVMTRDKTRLIPLLAFPMIMMLVLGYTSGNVPKHITAALVIHDASPLALQIEQEISGSQYFSTKFVVSTLGEARELLDTGKVRVIIQIPPDLDKHIAQGQSGSITVIVDESDSAVAATSRQMIQGIVAATAQRMREDSILKHQEDVGDAATILATYIGQTPADYTPLIRISEQTVMVLENAQKPIAQEKSIILANPKSPGTVTIPNGTTLVYGDRRTLLTADTIFLLDSTALQSMKLQTGLLDSSTAAIRLAQANTREMGTLAKQSAQDASQRMAVYDTKIQDSFAQIQEFTQSQAHAMLEPLTYAEQPAYGTNRRITDFLIPALIAMTIFQGAVMGMGRAVAGEKREGSLTRVFLTPTSNTTIIVGTLLFYVIFELIRASFLIGVAIILFDLKIQGSILLIGIVLAIYIAISTAIGMIMSSMVRTEQQFMAMAMLISLPTMFLSGVFFPVQAMPKAFQAVAAVLPVTYAADALRSVMVKGLSVAAIWWPVSILLLFLVIAYIGVVAVFKRDIE